jgi:hypothetical protein
MLSKCREVSLGEVKLCEAFYDVCNNVYNDNQHILTALFMFASYALINPPTHAHMRHLIKTFDASNSWLCRPVRRLAAVFALHDHCEWSC